MRKRALLFFLVLLVAAGCSGTAQPAAAPGAAAPSQGGSMQITSSAFGEGAQIPRRYTCDADNISPPLAWSGVPAAAQSLALIADDPDAPGGTWIHWVVFDLPAGAQGLPEAVKAQPSIAGGGTQGVTSFRKIGYGGPCPPSGVHRYYFRLYALDKQLGLPSSATAREVQAAMQGHVLAESALMGRYQRAAR